jgi:hypothetical protein
VQYRYLTLVAWVCLAVVPAYGMDSGASASWQSHTLKFHYSGFTTHYTCDGLEEKVREILLYLGARKDLKVTTSGCAYGANRPSPFAWVEATFSSLAPVADSSAKDAVTGRWQPFELSANRPSFMGAGECELIEQMRPTIEKGFSLRAAKYHTTCMAHQISLGDYSVSGNVLQPAPH